MEASGGPGTVGKRSQTLFMVETSSNFHPGDLCGPPDPPPRPNPSDLCLLKHKISSETSRTARPGNSPSQDDSELLLSIESSSPRCHVRGRIGIFTNKDKDIFFLINERHRSVIGWLRVVGEEWIHLHFDVGVEFVVVVHLAGWLPVVQLTGVRGRKDLSPQPNTLKIQN